MGILKNKRNRLSKPAQVARRRDFRAAIETFDLREIFTLEDLVQRLDAGVLSKDDPRSHAGVLIKKEISERRVTKVDKGRFKRVSVSATGTAGSSPNRSGIPNTDLGVKSEIPETEYGSARLALFDWVTLSTYGTPIVLTAKSLQVCAFFSEYTREAIGVFLRTYMVDALEELAKSPSGDYRFTKEGMRNLHVHRGLEQKPEAVPEKTRTAQSDILQASPLFPDRKSKAKKFGLTMQDKEARKQALECLFRKCGRDRQTRQSCILTLKKEFPGHKANVYGKILQGLSGGGFINQDHANQSIWLTGKGLTEIGQPIFVHQPESVPEPPPPEPEAIEVALSVPASEPTSPPPLPEDLEIRMDRDDVAALVSKTPALLDLLREDPHVIALLGGLLASQRELVQLLMELAVWKDHPWNKKRVPRRKRLAELEEEVKRRTAEGTFDSDTSQQILARISAELRELSR